MINPRRLRFWFRKTAIAACWFLVLCDFSGSTHAQLPATQNRQGSVQSWTFDYQYPPVGQRFWVQVSATEWLQAYSTGQVSVFMVVGGQTVNGNAGTIVRNTTDNPGDVFIPNLVSGRDNWAMFRSGESAAWQYLGKMYNIDATALPDNPNVEAAIAAIPMPTWLPGFLQRNGALATAAVNRMTPEERTASGVPRVPPPPLVQPTSSEPQVPSRVRLAGTLLAGSLISKTDPVYPQEAVKAGIQGTVVLDVIISRTGTVESAKPTSGPAVLVPAAVDAVKTWTYKPYLLNNAPVELETSVSINFKLSPSTTPAISATPSSQENTVDVKTALQTTAPTTDQVPPAKAAGPTQGDVLAMLAAALREKVVLPAANVKAIVAAGSGNSSEKNVRSNLKHCNDNTYTWKDAGVIMGDAAGECSQLGSSVERTLGETNAAAELAYQRACALPRLDIDPNIMDNYCGELGDLYVLRGNESLAAAVYKYAPNCEPIGFTPPPRSQNFDSACKGGVVATELRFAQQHSSQYVSSGSKQDAAFAVSWYQKAAALGSADAAYHLGMIYSGGWGGVAHDYAQAMTWFTKAAAQGNADAAQSLGQMYFNGTGVQRDLTKAFGFYLQAAQAGNLWAAEQVGDFYYAGWSGPKNLPLARSWYLQAWDNGNENGYEDNWARTLLPATTPALAAEQASNDGGSSESASDWQQDHQNKIDALTQEIAIHEKQAQQDDADAQQAEAQASQNSGISGGFGAIANAVNSGLNTGLAQHDRDAAQQERQQAQDERQQLAALGAEQPPVAVNNSEQIALTRVQTGMINNGQTISGALQQQQSNIQAVQQVQANARQIAQEEANGNLTPQQAMTQLQQQAQRGAQQQTQQGPATTNPAPATPSSVTETCPNMQGYSDYGVGCNPVKNMNSCIRVVSNTWRPNGGTTGMDAVVFSNTCSTTVRLTAGSTPIPTGGGAETQNVGAGQQFTWTSEVLSSSSQTWQYQADDGIDCTVNPDRPGCSNIGH
jgi:TonB family protein